MHLAAHRGHADICALLLAHGADPTLEDAKGMTPCMVAAHNGHHAVLRCLVADNGSGAQRFDGEHNFRTAALLLASAEGNAESVRALLQAPADARRAASCLHAALCGGDLASQRVVEVLLKGADVDGATEVTKSFDGKGEGGTHALHFAAEVGNRGVTKALLDADPDVDALDARGRTPLYVAAHHGHEDVVSSLLSAGADVNKREKFREETPLFAAARGGHLECVKALCAHEDVPTWTHGTTTGRRRCTRRSRRDTWHASIGCWTAAPIQTRLTKTWKRRFTSRSGGRTRGSPRHC